MQVHGDFEFASAADRAFAHHHFRLLQLVAFTAAGSKLEKSEVVMGEGPIRRTGEFEVTVHLHADVETKVKVIVAPEA